MSNPTIKKMAESFKDASDWQEYATAQQKTITDLSKMLSKLEAENIKLKAEVSNMSKPQVIVSSVNAEMADIEIICVAQLSRLKEASAVRELTFEETKKVATYTDTLVKTKEYMKEKGKDLSNLTDEELLSLMSTSSDTKQ